MIAIRKTKVKDALQIQKVYNKTWLNTYPSKELGITVQDIKMYTKGRRSKKIVSERKKTIASINKNKDKLSIVSTINKKIVGVSYAEIEKDYMNLRSIYVLPKYQRLGVGRLMMNYVFDYFKDQKEFRVNVATYNTKAIKFYESFGFRKSGKEFTEEQFRMPASKVCIPELEMILKKNI
jgi:ribosomal protein S18 acetylase RimI-like enzyme